MKEQVASAWRRSGDVFLADGRRHCGAPTRQGLFMDHETRLVEDVWKRMAPSRRAAAEDERPMGGKVPPSLPVIPIKQASKASGHRGARPPRNPVTRFFDP